MSGQGIVRGTIPLSPSDSSPNKLGERNGYRPPSALLGEVPVGWRGPVTLRNIASITLLLLSATLFGHSVWIFAKAQLAQVLLERAFTQSIATGKPVKAWRWADTYPVARIAIDRIGAEAIVLKGASGEAMAFGPAWVNETARPGTRGTSVMAAHRDTHFAFLKNVQVGDEIAVTRDDGLVFRYRATGMRVVNWNQSGIDAHEAGFHLALVTCFPFDAITRGPLRYVVNAELVR
ncbi:MAG: class GN sortase [Alphaproteobacteria bacterium]|nr:class GN sortase [Alphaproteobacteria bacterium]